jgi:acetyl-CoA acyltransferase 1
VPTKFFPPLQIFSPVDACPQSQAMGIFAEEIIPIEIEGQVISVDDTMRPNISLESLAGLKPVFPQWGVGTTTAGNASGVGDGAALCILTTRKRAEAEGMKILGKWVASAIVGQLVYVSCHDFQPKRCAAVEPSVMGISPIAAVNKILAQTGLSKDEIDVWEVTCYRLVT